MKSNTFSEINEESIDFYKDLMPELDMNAELASNIFSTVKNQDFNFETIVKESSLSQTSQDILLDIFNNPERTKEQLYAEISEDVELLLANEEISENEKDYMLSTMAILARTPNNRSNCYASGPGGAGEIDNASCGLLFGAAGAILGFGICNWPCSIGGFVIGFIVGASNC